MTPTEKIRHDLTASLDALTGVRQIELSPTITRNACVRGGFFQESLQAGGLADRLRGGK